MFTLTTAAARRKFSDLVNRVWYLKQRVTLTRYGRPLVVVIPIEDLARLERSRRKGGAAGKPGKRPARKR